MLGQVGGHHVLPLDAVRRRAGGDEVLEPEAALRIGGVGHRRQVGQAHRLLHRKAVRVVEQQRRLVAARIHAQPFEPVTAQHAGHAGAFRHGRELQQLLGARFGRIGLRNRAVGAPGVLGIEREAFAGGVVQHGATARLLAGMPRIEPGSGVEVALAAHGLRRLVRGRAGAEIPPVGPVAAHRLHGVAGLLARAVEELRDRAHAQLDAAGRGIALVEIPHEIRQLRLRRAVVVVAHIGDLHHQERMRIAGGFPLLGPARHAGPRLLHVRRDLQAAVRGHPVDEAVIGGDRPAAGRLPVEGARPWRERVAVMLVDRHRDAGDAVVEQRIDDAPGQAVDVGVHRRTHRNAEVAEEFQRLQHVEDHRMVHQRRHVPAHAGDFDLPALHRGEEAVAVGVGGVHPPVHRPAGDFAGPAELGVIGVVGGALGNIERLVDEAAVQFHHHRLRVGVPDVGMTMMHKENFVDHGFSHNAGGEVNRLRRRRA